MFSNNQKKRTCEPTQLLINYKMTTQISRKKITILPKPKQSSSPSKDDDDAPRFLTESEIEHILKSVPMLPASSVTVAQFNRDSLIKVYRHQLENVKLKPSKFDAFRAVFQNRNIRALIQAGTPVGFSASEGLSQPVVQATLSTFHNAGREGVGGAGTRAFFDLLYISQMRETTLAHIHLNNVWLSHTDVIQAGRAFQTFSVKTLTKAIEIVAHPTSSDGNSRVIPWYYPLFESYATRQDASFRMPPNYTTSPFIRLTLDPQVLFMSRITTHEISEVIDRGGGTICIFSPTYEGIIDIYTTNDIATLLVSKAQEKAELKALKTLTNKSLNTASKREISSSATIDQQPITSELLIDRIPKTLFQQIFLQNEIRRLKADNLVVSSNLRMRSLNATVPETKVIPMSVKRLSLFKDYRIIATKIEDSINGETFVHGDTNIRRVWLNQSTFATAYKYFPLEKILASIRDVAGADSILEITPEYILVRPAPDRLSPSNEILAAIIANRTKGAAEWTLKMSEFLIRNSEGLIEAPPPPPNYLMNCTYYYIAGLYPVIPSLRLLVQHPAINGQVTVSNLPREVAETFGIEAARSMLFLELQHLVLSNGKTIHPSHVQLIVDLMSACGVLIPFTPRGNGRLQFGAYAECSVTALEAFKKSAIGGKKEPLTATSAAILVGNLVKLGTGLVESIPTFSASDQQHASAPSSTAPIDLESIAASLIDTHNTIRPDTGEGINAIDAMVLHDSDTSRILDAPSSNQRSFEGQVDDMPSTFGSLVFPPPPSEIHNLFRTM